ncbi:MAG: hypothetical protein NZ550_04070 [Fimbriimonadales bacterium]|nr:hypothetical protein [Fimbriimonadales bacterium]MDW8051495.1 hypothetical protein [Armatimonadota bacterium]
MLAQLLRGFALWIGLYVLLTATHWGVLHGINALRTRYETAVETRLGVEAIDREPPYGVEERIIVALDIQPSPYWQESLGMSALMSLIVAILVGIGALRFRRSRAFKLAITALVANGLVFYAYSVLSEQLFAGYLLGRPVSAVVPALLVGVVHAVISALVLGGGKQ